ncbi:MAG: MBL fold metallo-hydrolase [Gammaproteobacteria bacterium]
MRFCCLGSGSRGNAFVVEYGATTLLVDCGFKPSDLRRRLARHFIALSEIDAVLIGHEHGDHTAGLESLAAAGIAAYMTSGTARALNFRGARTVRSGDPLHIGDLHIAPVTVPHDAGEPVQFVFGGRLGIFTDLGHITPAVRNACRGLRAMIIECNYAADMLAANNRYPARLKKRIAGKYGHLENDAAAELVARVDSARLRYVVAAHLSEHNNAEARVRKTLSRACDSQKITVADQKNGSEWIAVPA